jgi:ribonuclease Z
MQSGGPSGPAAQPPGADDVSGRDLVVLGTASQAPTRTRNHNGYLLRWDGTGVLFDPGEGTQRQLTLAGVPPTAITRVCLTHLHGDHCLGLPGILQRLALDGGETGPDGDDGPGALPVAFPASGRPYVERLADACVGRRVAVRLEPVPPDRASGPRRPELGAHPVDPGPPLAITARALDHRIDAVGYRLEEPAGRRMLPERLARAGIAGADIGTLQHEGVLRRADHVVTLEEMSEPRPGHAVAVVMDTRVCDAAVALAEGVDLLLCEATFLDADRHLAERYGHLTAGQAAAIARASGARHLVLTHFSARYPDLDGHRAEAEAVFPAVTIARDLTTVEIPRRRD